MQVKHRLAHKGGEALQRKRHGLPTLHLHGNNLLTRCGRHEPGVIRRHIVRTAIDCHVGNTTRRPFRRHIDIELDGQLRERRSGRNGLLAQLLRQADDARIAGTAVKDGTAQSTRIIGVVRTRKNGNRSGQCARLAIARNRTITVAELRIVGTLMTITRGGNRLREVGSHIRTPAVVTVRTALAVVAIVVRGLEAVRILGIELRIDDVLAAVEVVARIGNTVCADHLDGTTHFVGIILRNTDADELAILILLDNTIAHDGYTTGQVHLLNLTQARAVNRDNLTRVGQRMRQTRYGGSLVLNQEQNRTFTTERHHANRIGHLGVTLRTHGSLARDAEDDRRRGHIVEVQRGGIAVAIDFAHGGKPRTLQTNHRTQTGLLDDARSAFLRVLIDRMDGQRTRSGTIVVAVTRRHRNGYKECQDGELNLS